MNHSDISGNLSDSFQENDTSTIFTLPALLLSDYLIIPCGILMVIENIISIGLLYVSTRLTFQIRILSLNLAISDLLTGFFLSIPNTMLYEKYHCNIKKYLGFLFTTVSLLIITMMNADRCFIFVLAMRYYSFVTKKLVIKISVALWFFGLFITYGTFFDLEDRYGLTCMVAEKRNVVTYTSRSILLFIMVLNLIMLIYLIYQIRIKLGQPSDIKDPTQATMFAREQATIARKISIIIGVFLMAFFPFMITQTFPFDNDTHLFKQTYAIAAMFMLFNSACNPIFYVWRFSQPRYHLKRMLCFWNKNQRREMKRKYNQENACYVIDSKREILNTTTKNYDSNIA